MRESDSLVEDPTSLELVILYQCIQTRGLVNKRIGLLLFNQSINQLIGHRHSSPNSTSYFVA